MPVVRILTQTIKIVAIAGIGLLVAVGATRAMAYYLDEVRADDAGRPVTVAVADGEGASDVAAKLEDEGLIRSKTYFETQIRLSGVDLVVGEHNLRKGMSVPEIVDVMTGGGEQRAAEGDAGADDEAETSTQVTIIEGWRTEQIAAALEEANLEGGVEAFIEATKEDYSERFSFLEGLPEGATLEGFLFPDTYTITSNMSAADAVEVMLQNFDAKYNPELRTRTEEMGLSLFEVVTLASIVEREAQARKERPIIAAVYLNRIEADMLLQADPTVQYVIGTEEDWWPKVGGSQTGIDNPYNTYVYKGFPPGPIANPGLASIQGVLTPDENDYLFFVAKQDETGEHVFTADLAEHEQNICTYLGTCNGAAVPPEGGAPADIVPVEEPPAESTG